MIGKRLFANGFILFFMFIFIVFSQPTLFADEKKPRQDCLNQAVKRIKEIRSLPDKKYLNTLDGQRIQLNEFFNKCNHLFPQCCLFAKFYYWQSDVRQVFSNTQSGKIEHKIRCYHNCLSTYCPDSCNPRKTHGDVAEFYDQIGNFMGFAVYVGDGKYCPLPYDGYTK